MRYIVGIDEVGRGPLAGPVVVAVALVPVRLNLRRAARQLKIPLRDSKKLSPLQRETWRTFVKHSGIHYCIARVFPRTIDGINIYEAANLAASRALRALLKKNLHVTRAHVYIDAGIKISQKVLMASGRTLYPHVLPKADELVPAVSIASIIAKCDRDRTMCRLHTRFPAYRFDRHKGYGTKLHLEALRIHGPCPAHRLTFLKRFGTINQ